MNSLLNLTSVISTSLRSVPETPDYSPILHPFSPPMLPVHSTPTDTTESVTPRDRPRTRTHNESFFLF